VGSMSSKQWRNGRGRRRPMDASPGRLRVISCFLLHRRCITLGPNQGLTFTLLKEVRAGPLTWSSRIGAQVQ
jgi:hypothetical protein